ncbi:TIGR02996 domain-containing protein [Gemmata obscuriglobus]|uniref:TIGR02996 domain-containing protein n=1 Tax=Gemmata obscuriglobus TaxID=114 RepID=A0A2Z3GSN2_9BACT|nr:TIGR02996 domain-containing protein [Gemmata obscuriglobus]
MPRWKWNCLRRNEVMSGESACLRSVVATPTDKTPRLVYTDWLDENNQPCKRLYGKQNS